MCVDETRRDCSRREALIRPEEPISPTSSFVEADRIPWVNCRSGRNLQNREMRGRSPKSH
jgi:hypothetical protein